MKKLAIILLFALVFLLPLRAHAQSANWVALQSDAASLNAPGQTVTLAVNASLDTSINGASLILKYDPGCFKVTGHQAGTLLAGATSFVQDQPGQLDLTYYFQGQGKGLTGAGSLIMIQLETLQMCASDISITPETFTLGVLDSQGMAFNLPGVEYRDMVVHLAPANGQAVVTPQAAAGAAPAASVGLTPPSGPAFFGLGENGIWLIIGAVGLLFVLIVGVIVFFYLRGRKTPASSQNTTPILGPALIHKGGTVTLPQKRTQLGRHIEIVYNNGGFFMVDSGSRLGVYINGKRLGNGSYPLSHGDRVQLGQEISYQFIHTRVNSAQRG